MKAPEKKTHSSRAFQKYEKLARFLLKYLVLIFFKHNCSITLAP
jgi:hypothetical protein